MTKAIVPTLWFNNNAREAVDFYVSVFPDGKIIGIDYYTEFGEEITGHKKGDIVTIEFEIMGTRFLALNAGPEFVFNPSVSFMIRCADQREIDHYWDKLSASREDEQCGWLKDRYGLSWQVVPAILEDMLKNGSEKQRRNVTEAFMAMKKFDIGRLVEAYEQDDMNTDRSKLLENAAAVAARIKQLRDPHITPLTAFVDELRREAGPGAEIPYFDPWDGGVEATTLFLLEAPGRKAVQTGFVSRNNPDETAKNFYELSLEAGIDRRKTIVWNVVPWYIGNGKKRRAPTSKDLAEGLKPLPRLLALLPKLRTVVLVGRKAEKAAMQIDKSRYTLFTCPHPSPMFVNNAPGNREKILRVLRELVV